MEKVDRSEVLGLGAYEGVREHFRRRVIEAKRSRRIIVNGEMSVVFENHDTVLLQIQEMLRTERITREAAVQHEIETYNELVPGANELSATAFLEIEDPELREGRLVELAGLESHLWLEVDGARVRAQGGPRGVLPDRTTAIHYLKVALGPERADALRRVAAEGTTERVAWVVDHPKFSARVSLPVPVLRSLADDLAD